MEKNQILEMLSRVGGIITDSHIVYTSGKHGNAYINKDAIYPHTEQTSKLCQAIAEEFAHMSTIQVVIAPAIGAIILSQWVA